MKVFLSLVLILAGVMAFRVFTRSNLPLPVDGQRLVVTSDNHGPVPVVVELFTSEGCSSCPPADDVLATLDKTPTTGVEIIALGEHVDYWNRLGWVDQYSSEKFSQRQSDYSDAFKLDSVYTPQMIVDGRDEFNGGNMARARAAITKATQSPKGIVELALTDQKLSVQVKNLPRITAGEKAEVLLAITENNLRTDVSRGENSGRFLHHSAVVRELSVLGELSPKETSFEATPNLTLAENWRKENLRVAVFVQERGTRRILAAAIIGLLSR
ncbi:MAG TPA: DUF1223 domain-containing protein [Pyrinomonadaceae bacterium]|nr:DUF1223 domain-containing protein [Pyrinomonadaceae bacterium]